MSNKWYAMVPVIWIEKEDGTRVLAQMWQEFDTSVDPPKETGLAQWREVPIHKINTPQNTWSQLPVPKHEPEPYKF